MLSNELTMGETVASPAVAEDEWQQSTDTQSSATGVRIDYVDIQLPDNETSLKFTFLWLEEDRWEGKDYAVEVALMPFSSPRTRLFFVIVPLSPARLRMATR